MGPNELSAVHSAEAPKLLLAEHGVEDLAAWKLLLTDAGYDVVCASHGQEALAQLAQSPYQAIVYSATMPDITATDWLEAVRQIDLDVPIILLASGPALAGSTSTAGRGALRTLTKPVTSQSLLESISQSVVVHRMAKAKRQALDVFHTPAHQPGERAALTARFAMAQASLYMAYQPIVDCQQALVFGYEALVRCEEPSVGHPGVLFDIAERLGCLLDLGRQIRARVAQDIAALPVAAHACHIFVNLHTRDLLDDALFDPRAPLSQHAHRVVFEITERTALDEVQDVGVRIARLRQLGFRIAIDDLGAGYAGLSTFAQLEPEVVKLDMSLVRDLHARPTKRKIIESMAHLCQELRIQMIAEGVETQSERDLLAELGCTLLQGYYFGRPKRGFIPPTTY